MLIEFLCHCLGSGFDGVVGCHYGGRGLFSIGWRRGCYQYDIGHLLLLERVMNDKCCFNSYVKNSMYMNRTHAMARTAKKYIYII